MSTVDQTKVILPHTEQLQVNETPVAPTIIEQYMELNGANKFLAAHCGKSIGTQEILIRGISHSVNRCNAEYADCWDAVKEVAHRCGILEHSQEEANAAIGRLQEQVRTLEEAIEKSRKAYGELLKKHLGR